MTTDQPAPAEEPDAPGLMQRPGAIWLIFGSIAVFLLMITILIANLVDPAPPKTIRLATAAPGGAYAAGGEALRRRLAEEGITVELVETSGSVENFALLTAEEAPVDAAILQGGIGVGAAAGQDLQSLGSLFFEPLFVFTRTDQNILDLRDLRAKRIAVGPEGSGTRALATMLLNENDLGPDDVTLSEEGGAGARGALENGWVDAAIFVTALDRPYIQALLEEPSVSLLGFQRADAYGRRHRYLSAITLPRGVIDLAQDIPSTDTIMVAPAASLVVNPDLHPALQELLLEAIFDEYSDGNVLVPRDTFPRADLTAFPLTDEARRYFTRGGPPFLQRYLPFWAANLVDRLWVFMIPLATLLYPLIKAAPPIYRWQVRRRIIRWYRDLRQLELDGRSAGTADEKSHVRAELTRILREVGDLEVPLSYNDDVYRLRSHIRFVDQLLMETENREAGNAGAAL